MLTIIHDESYYLEAYEELFSLLKFKKWQPPGGAILIIIGACFYIYDKNKIRGGFSLIFPIVGLYEIFRFYYDRWKWLIDRKKIISKPRIIICRDGLG